MVGIALGVGGLMLYQQLFDAGDGVEAGSDSTRVAAHEFALAVDDEGLPTSSDVNRFHRSIYLPEKGGQVHVKVIGLSATAVGVELMVVVSNEERNSTQRRLQIRAMQSFEPVFTWLPSGKKCWIEPETSWGGVHRHTGLGVSMKITDE